MASRARHPWWCELAVVVRGHAQTTPGRVARGAAVGLGALALAVLLCVAMRAHLRENAEAVALAFAAHAGLIATLLALAAFTASRRFAHAHAESLHSGWWRAAPVDRGSIDRVVVAVALLAGCASIGLLALGAACTALLAGRALPMTALVSCAIAVLAGGLAGAAAANWRRRHPATLRRAGIRVPVLRIATPASAAPHLFDWQRREAVMRWRTGSNIKLIGVYLALTPGASQPWQVAGALMFVAATAWLGAVLTASGDVTQRARQCLQATPLDAAALRWAGLRYPLLALAAASLVFAGGVALSGGVGPLPVLCVAVAGLLSVRGVTSLVRLRDAGSAR